MPDTRGAVETEQAGEERGRRGTKSVYTSPAV
jgi:hypothetical protein